MLAGFGHAPYIMVWEMTQACDLACLHCRASARPQRSPRELSTAEAEALLRQVRGLQAQPVFAGGCAPAASGWSAPPGRPGIGQAPPLLVLSGGDPMKRPDLFHLVEFGTRLGVRVSFTPSVTPLLTQAALAELKARGLARLAISIDGATAASHDGFRGVRGAWERSLATVAWGRELKLPLQINTTLGRHNEHEFDALAALMESLDLVLWSVFFMVPVGRAQQRDCLGGEAMERLFAKLYALSLRVRFDVKTTEAMHYRRYVAQQHSIQHLVRRSPDGIGRAPRGLNDGKGFLFIISHEGEVYPSGFLPLSVGNIRQQPLADIYTQAPLLRSLRDPARLEGKCRVCEFRALCGGSRARAFAYTGNPFAADPACVYQPAAWAGGAA